MAISYANIYCFLIVIWYRFIFIGDCKQTILFMAISYANIYCFLIVIYLSSINKF